MPHKSKVRHTFLFETSDDWNPNKPYCWGECPFSMNIKLGESCRYKSEDLLTCPFVKFGMIDDESYTD